MCSEGCIVGGGVPWHRLDYVSGILQLHVVESFAVKDAFLLAR